jgi:hypothetical protein
VKAAQEYEYQEELALRPLVDVDIDGKVATHFSFVMLPRGVVPKSRASSSLGTNDPCAPTVTITVKFLPP